MAESRQVACHLPDGVAVASCSKEVSLSTRGTAVSKLLVQDTVRLEILKVDTTRIF